ncbi:hypothetical protein B5M44_04020 [Shinella sumterensis]|uniref:hypothetical protein n=1 Tax=Shinella sumterensis TaxID=1967501 RepID=UPI00106EE732|nr:hypothetical protein [Shinella sumterensis]MCD1264090.1 hypothetical protein [Shinella sumterensis]TFE99379.1 hypothetical protein B5M44_04020 [Shinella sumterensis]
MTGSEIMAVVGFFVMLSGTLWGIWWRIEGKVEKAKTEAAGVAASANALALLTRQELADHKLHTAETYVTKAGMQEQTAQIMRAIEGVGNRIDGLGERLDRLYEARPGTRRSS